MPVLTRRAAKRRRTHPAQTQFESSSDDDDNGLDENYAAESSCSENGSSSDSCSEGETESRDVLNVFDSKNTPPTRSDDLFSNSDSETESESESSSEEDRGHSNFDTSVLIEQDPAGKDWACVDDLPNAGKNVRFTGGDCIQISDCGARVLGYTHVIVQSIMDDGFVGDAYCLEEDLVSKFGHSLPPDGVRHGKYIHVCSNDAVEYKHIGAVVEIIDVDGCRIYNHETGAWADGDSRSMHGSAGRFMLALKKSAVLARRYGGAFLIEKTPLFDQMLLKGVKHCLPSNRPRFGYSRPHIVDYVLRSCAPPTVISHEKLAGVKCDFCGRRRECLGCQTGLSKWHVGTDCAQTLNAFGLLVQHARFLCVSGNTCSADAATLEARLQDVVEIQARVSGRYLSSQHPA